LKLTNQHVKKRKKFLKKCWIQNRLEREEKMTNIAKAKSEIFRNYTLGFATLATIIKCFL
ncbi:TPA: hypothetical protein ACXD6T_002272, partial [Staphylococcus aureus]